MIRRIPFHEGNSLTLYGVSYDDGGPIPHILCLFQRHNYLTKIESVNLKDVPVESLPFVCQRLHRHDLFSQTILLYSISINDSRKIPQFEFRSRHGRLPCLALVQFPISQQRVDSIVLLVDLTGQSHTDSGRQTDSERATWELDWSSVTFGENEPVSVRPVRAFGIVTHLVEVQ